MKYIAAVVGIGFSVGLFSCRAESPLAEWSRARTSGPARPKFLDELRPLHFVRWTKLRSFHPVNVVLQEPGVLTYGTLSSDGRKLLSIREIGRSFHHPVVADLLRGEISRLLPPGYENEVLNQAWWPPGESSHAIVPMRRKPGEVRGPRYWRIKTDNSAVSEYKELPGLALVGPTPDGKAWIVAQREPAGKEGDSENEKYVQYIQSRSDPSSRLRVDWSLREGILSPDCRFVYGDVSFSEPWSWHGFYDRKSKQTVPVFTPDQAWLKFGRGISIWGPARWLPDSSGVLVNIGFYINERLKGEIWELSLEGEVHSLTQGVEIIGSSDNGVHWLFRVGSDYYTASVSEGGPSK